MEQGRPLFETCHAKVKERLNSYLKSLLENSQLLSWWRNSPSSMEPGISLPCSQESILSQINSVHTLEDYIFKIHYHLPHTPTPMSDQFLSSFAFIFTPSMRAVTPAHTIPLDYITLII